MRRVITLCAYNRPHYLARVLAGLAVCHGVEDYLLVAAIEPGDDDVMRLLLDVNFCETKLYRHINRRGIRANTHFALSRGFERGDYVIHLEDDVVPAPDCLAYFEHCRERYAGDPEIFTVTAYNGPHRRGPAGDYKPLSVYTPEERYQLRRVAWFTPSGWATWADRWAEMRGNWQMAKDGIGWGPHLNKVIRGERCQIYPVLARTQNIGAEGQNVRDRDWFRDCVYNPHWAGALDLSPGNYWEANP